MNIWVYIGNRNEIVAINNNDMDGNSGWVSTTVALLTQNINGGIDELLEKMTASYSVPRFLLVNGVAVERSQTDIDSDTVDNMIREDDPIDILSGRVTTIEGATDEITLLLADVMGGAI